MYVDNSILENVKNIHFIGIGGSGMFPIVQILHSKGYHITGSDHNDGDIITRERKMGIDVKLGHHASHILGADLIVYSAAISEKNIELVAARKSGIKTVERSIMLGLLTAEYSNCICIAGTHGKTTTTALLTQILLGAEIDPTAVIGGKLPIIDGYGRVGRSDIMVCEACEFVDTFLKLSPDIAVILNVDADHLDYFKTMENLKRSFHTFADKATKQIIVNGDDKNSLDVIKGCTQQIITFGFDPKNDYYAENIIKKGGITTTFSLMYRGTLLTEIELNIPGRHNILNALAACVCALSVGVEPSQLAETAPKFGGAGRRFELLGKVREITIADDYAHHPAELTVTLNAAKQMEFNQVWAVFQPFTYSRTDLLLDDFATALAIADRVVMSEIMGGREENERGIYTKDLACKIPGSMWFDSFDEIADYVMSHAKPGDLVITLGCGDVYKCAKMMLTRAYSKRISLSAESDQRRRWTPQGLKP